MEIKNWKRVGLGAMTSLSAVALAACSNSSNSSSSPNDEINWFIPIEISTLDISEATDTYSSVAIGNPGSNLLRRDEGDELQLSLAEKVEVSDDGLAYTVALRDDLKWSNGSDLIAKDFVYSWQRIVDPATTSEYAYLVSGAHVLNAEGIVAGTKSIDELSVKADGNKFIFTLSDPSPRFMNLPSFASFMPQSEDFVEEAGDGYGTASEKSLYSGPYTVEDRNGTSGVFTLVKNKYYWDARDIKTEKVNVQTIRKPDTAVQMCKDDDLNYANISNTEATYRTDKNHDSIVDAPEVTTAYMVYNQTGTVTALSNTKIRRALNLVTNREEIVKAAIDIGLTAATALAPTDLETLPDGTDLAEYVSPGYSHDEEGAAKLFKEGLTEPGADSITLTITTNSDAPVAKAAVDYIKETWEDTPSGLTVEEKFVTFKQRPEGTKSQNFDVALVFWGGDYPEGSIFYGLFATNSSYNYGKFSNADYDAAYQRAITTDALNPAATADDCKAAGKALYDNAFYNPIYFRNGKGPQNPDLRGLVRSSTNLSVGFTYAYKE